MFPDLFKQLRSAKSVDLAEARKSPPFIFIKGRNLLDFTSWDFLNIQQNQRVKHDVVKSLEVLGAGSGSPRTLSGTSPQHLSCERKIAQFFDSESALLFSSKNQLVLSLIMSIGSEHDLFFYDELCQSPVADACYLLNASALPFCPSKLGSLERELEKSKAFNRRFIFTETFSPLRGVAPELTEILALAKRYDAFVIVDESYAVGAIGAHGAGVLELLFPRAAAGVNKAAEISKTVSVPILAGICDLSLGVNSFGAALFGPKVLCDYILSTSKTLARESSLPAIVACAIESSLGFIETQSLSRLKLKQAASKLKLAAAELSPDSRHLKDEQAPLACLYFDKHHKANKVLELLFQNGYHAEVVGLPTLFSESCALRFVPTIAHTQQHIDSLCNCLTEIVPKLKI